jgi:DNA-binding MarR family transcriptional regulator
MKRGNKSIQDVAVKELDTIKRLLMLLLLKAGASQGEIAKILKMDQGNFSRAYKVSKVKRFSER